MSNTSTETYESISGAVQLVASQAGKYFGGAVGQAYATFLTGQNSWVASVSDLAAKVQNGTATGEDFADVASKTASILAGFGVLTGTAAPWTLLATGAVGGALWAWKNKESIMDYGEKVFDGIEKIKDLIIDHSETTLPEIVVTGQPIYYDTTIDYWDFYYYEDIPSGTVNIGDLTTLWSDDTDSMDGTNYNQDGTSYQ